MSKHVLSRNVARIGACLVVALLVASPAVAQDQNQQITDEFKNGLKLWEDGDAAGALESVRLLEAWLMELAAAGLEAVFGELPGWAMEIESQAAGAAFMGGGIGASCRYTMDESTMEASIFGDSPLLGMVTGLMGNPLMSTASGKKIIKIKGMKAVVGEENGEWELQMPFRNTFLIIVKGPSLEFVKACVEAMDLARLEEIAASGS